MPLPDIADVLRCQVTGTTGSSTPWSNTWHIRWDGTGTLADAKDNAEADLAAFYNSYKILCTTEMTASVFRITPLFDDLASSVYTEAIQGTATGDTLPPDTAVVLSLRTSKRGSRYRGRVFLPATNEGTNTSEGRLASATITLIDGYAATLKAALLADGLNLCIASYKYASQEPVTNTSVDNIFDRQRRRRS